MSGEGVPAGVGAVGVGAAGGEVASAARPGGGTLRRVATSTRLVATDLARNRVALGLLLLVPTAFYALVYATTGARPISFRLSGAGDALLTGIERDVSLLFVGLAAVGGLSAFLAFTLVLRPAAADRRLVFEGYRPWELLAAKALTMAGAAGVLAVYLTALLPVFFRPSRATGVFTGFLLTSLLYGALGLAVGAAVRRELEGILFILLLVNIDAGWLQNPVFYGHSHNRALIRLLPGHHPGQVAMLSAFTHRGLGREAAASLAYTAVVLAAAGFLYWRRVRVRR